MEIPELIECFKKTLEDGYVSRSEKKALRNVLSDVHLNNQELALLRNAIFDIARKEIAENNIQEILEWLEDATKLIHTDNDNTKQENIALFSPGDECMKAINGLMRRAQNEILICVFTITDNRIRNVILDRHNRGIRVEIITDNDKAYDKGADIHFLHDHGLTVRVDKTDAHMHHKFAVIDKKWVLSGSYNWTRSAAESNHENLVFSDDPKLVKSFVEEFQKLWPLTEPY